MKRCSELWKIIPFDRMMAQEATHFFEILDVSAFCAIILSKVLGNFFYLVEIFLTFEWQVPPESYVYL